MRNPYDITLTLSGDDFRVTAQSNLGGSFIAAHVPDYSADRIVPAEQARKIADKAEAQGLAVLIDLLANEQQ